jgi:hypothetical protein
MIAISVDIARRDGRRCKGHGTDQDGDAKNCENDLWRDPPPMAYLEGRYIRRNSHPCLVTWEASSGLTRSSLRATPGGSPEETGAFKGVFAKACELGVEGIVSKRLGGAYWRGPCRNWLKVKNPAFLPG